MLEIGVLGPLAVRRDGHEVADLSPMLRRLIALLVARPGSAMSVDALAEYLWAGQPPRTARKTIAVYVHRLRKALGGDERITFSANGYAIVVAEEELDLLRFDALAKRSAGLSGPAAAQATAEALALWRGEAFQGFRDLEPVAPVADRLVDTRAALLEQRFQAELDLGLADQVVAAIQDAIAENPFRERLRGQLMIALYRLGRQADALDVFRRTHEMLTEELGLEPGPQLQELHQRILAADPALAAVEQVPQQLPRDVPDFTGRAADLAWLDEAAALSGATAIISAVSGVGGVGKTALAVHWGATAGDRFPDGQLYVNLRGFGPTPPMPAAVALEHLLRGIGVPPENLPSDPEQASAMLRSRLAGRRVLMVLDNAYSADQVRPLLPGGSTSFVVVTSRRTLGGLIAREGARLLHLDVLAEAEALQLLAGVVGEERLRAEPDAARELITLCGNLPLALRLASANLAEEPSLKLADYVHQVAADRMSALSVPDDPDSAVRAVFAHSLSRLGEREALLFRRIGLVAANDISVWMAAVLIDSTEAVALATLERLADASLVNRRGTRYQMHDLVQLFAAEAAGSDDLAALRRAYEMLLWLTLEADSRLANRSYPTPPWPAELAAPDAATASVPDSDQWLDAERALILGSAHDAAGRGWVDLSWHLVAAVTNACGFLAYVADWEQAAQYQLDAGVDGYGAAALSLAMGGSLRSRGNALSGLPYLRNARRGFLRSGDVRHAAVAATQLCIAHRILGHRRAAVAAAQWAISRFDPDRVDAQLAWAYIALGNLYMEGGRERLAARAAFERAITAAGDDRTAYANALGNLAGCLRYLEPAPVVLAMLEEARAAFGQTGDLLGECHTDCVAAEILLDGGDLVEAQRRAERAVELAQGTPHLQGIRMALTMSGRVALAGGDLPLARERLTAALEAARGMGGVAATAKVLRYLAQLYEAIGRRDQAVAAAAEARELFARLGHPDGDEIAAWLRSLS